MDASLSGAHKSWPTVKPTRYHESLSHHSPSRTQGSPSQSPEKEPSLLQRMRPGWTRPDLLDRIQLTHTSPGSKVSLLDRLSDAQAMRMEIQNPEYIVVDDSEEGERDEDEEVDELDPEEGEVEITEVTKSAPMVANGDGLKHSALESRSALNNSLVPSFGNTRSIQTTSTGPQRAQTEHAAMAELVPESPASGFAVHDLLHEMDESIQTSQDKPTITKDSQPSSSPNPLIPSRFTDKSQEVTLEDVKKAMIPIILHNALLRDPGADPVQLRHKLEASLSDDDYQHFYHLAKEVKKQMTERKSSSSPANVPATSGSSEMKLKTEMVDASSEALRQEPGDGHPVADAGSHKRQREEDHVEEEGHDDEHSRPIKSPRTETLPPTSSEMPSSGSSHALMTRDLRTVPKTPRAMLSKDKTVLNISPIPPNSPAWREASRSGSNSRVSTPTINGSASTPIRTTTPLGQRTNVATVDRSLSVANSPAPGTTSQTAVVSMTPPVNAPQNPASRQASAHTSTTPPAPPEEIRVSVNNDRDSQKKTPTHLPDKAQVSGVGTLAVEKMVTPQPPLTETQLSTPILGESTSSPRPAVAVNFAAGSLNPSCAISPPTQSGLAQTSAPIESAPEEVNKVPHSADSTGNNMQLNEREKLASVPTDVNVPAVNSVQPAGESVHAPPIQYTQKMTDIESPSSVDRPPEVLFEQASAQPPGASIHVANDAVLQTHSEIPTGSPLTKPSGTGDLVQAVPPANTEAQPNSVHPTQVLVQAWPIQSAPPRAQPIQAVPNPPPTQTEDVMEIDPTQVVSQSAPVTSGFVFITAGKPRPEVFEESFEVDPKSSRAASRWAHRLSRFNPDASHRSYSLLCLPALAVNEVYSKIAADLTLPPSAIFTTLSSIPTQWPKKGEVMIVVNPDTEKEKTLFPYDIDGALDLTPYILPGKNTVRVIQLGELSQYFFVLQFAPPSAAEVGAIGMLREEKRCREMYVPRIPPQMQWQYRPAATKT